MRNKALMKAVYSDNIKETRALLAENSSIPRNFTHFAKISPPSSSYITNSKQQDEKKKPTKIKEAKTKEIKAVKNTLINQLDLVEIACRSSQKNSLTILQMIILDRPHEVVPHLPLVLKKYKDISEDKKEFLKRYVAFTNALGVDASEPLNKNLKLLAEACLRDDAVQLANIIDDSTLNITPKQLIASLKLLTPDQHIARGLLLSNNVMFENIMTHQSSSDQYDDIMSLLKIAASSEEDKEIINQGIVELLTSHPNRVSLLKLKANWFSPSIATRMHRMRMGNDQLLGPKSAYCKFLNAFDQLKLKLSNKAPKAKDEASINISSQKIDPVHAETLNKSDCSKKQRVTGPPGKNDQKYEQSHHLGS